MECTLFNRLARRGVQLIAARENNVQCAPCCYKFADVQDEVVLHRAVAAQLDSAVKAFTWMDDRIETESNRDTQLYKCCLSSNTQYVHSLYCCNQKSGCSCGGLFADNYIDIFFTHPELVVSERICRVMCFFFVLNAVVVRIIYFKHGKLWE